MAIAHPKPNLEPYVAKIDYSAMSTVMSVYAQTLGSQLVDLSSLSSYDMDSPIGNDNLGGVYHQGTTSKSWYNQRYEHLYTIDNIIEFNRYIVSVLRPKSKDPLIEDIWKAYVNIFGAQDSLPKNINYHVDPAGPRGVNADLISPQYMSPPTGKLSYMDFTYTDGWDNTYTRKDRLSLYLIGDPDMIDYLSSTPGVIVHDLQDMTRLFKDEQLTNRDFLPSRLRFKASVFDTDDDDTDYSYEYYSRKEAFNLSEASGTATYYATRVMDIKPSERIYQVSMTLSKNVVERIFNRNVNCFVSLLLSDGISTDSPYRMTMKQFADFIS
jgi:hypothetical protein